MNDLLYSAQRFLLASPVGLVFAMSSPEMTK